MMGHKLARDKKHNKNHQNKNIHTKSRHNRMDALQKALTHIVQYNCLIVVGKFGAKGLAKTKMAKSVNYAATKVLKMMLTYKARGISIEDL